ncbi:MAG: TIGR04283 family arsenosugar biosynthesis glycosyltransferase [Gemmatimonadota bacterium]
MSLSFSLIIPTLNEARRLAGTLVFARLAFGNDTEYIVSDGGSTDATLDIARAAGATVVRGAVGRGEQLQRGVVEAHGDICVFLHADTTLPATARSAIEHMLDDQTVVGGAFSIEFPDSGKRLRMLQRAINFRSRLLHNATGDQVIFVRRSVLDSIGGVPNVPLFEDVRLCRALKRRGQFAILEEKVTTSPRLWHEVGTTRGILLHLSLRALHALGISPLLLARCYPQPR